MNIISTKRIQDMGNGLTKLDAGEVSELQVETPDTQDGAEVEDAFDRTVPQSAIEAADPDFNLELSLTGLPRSMMPSAVQASSIGLRQHANGDATLSWSRSATTGALAGLAGGGLLGLAINNLKSIAPANPTAALILSVVGGVLTGTGTALGVAAMNRSIHVDVNKRFSTITLQDLPPKA